MKKRMLESSASAPRKSGFARLGRSKISFMLVFALPPFLLYLLFFLLPLIDSIRISFFKWSGYTPTMEFVGLKNYFQILSDRIFQKAVLNDFLIVIGKEILIVGLAVFFAIALTRLRLRKREVAAYRFLYFLPNVLSVIIITSIWSFVLNPSIGLLNGFLELIGLDGATHAWLGEYGTVLPSIIFIASWAGVGFFMIVLIAAINNVPSELYEAAKLDGAGEWAQTIHITLPAIWNQMKFVIVTILYQTLAGSYALIMPLTNGGPDNASQVMGLYIYQMGLQNNRVGYANAAAVILMIITMVVSLLCNRVLNRSSMAE